MGGAVVPPQAVVAFVLAAAGGRPAAVFDGRRHNLRNHAGVWAASAGGKRDQNIVTWRAYVPSVH